MVDYSKQIIELRNQGFTYKQIQDELKCAKSTIYAHCKKNKIIIDFSQRVPNNVEIEKFQQLYDEGKNMKEIGNLLNWSRKTVARYVVRPEKIKLTPEEFKIRRVKNVVNWRKRLKVKAVEYKGGKCMYNNCGYNKCISALEFHHLNPNEKDFSLSERGNCVSWEKVKVELDKCILVCANCHREIHEEISK